MCIGFGSRKSLGRSLGQPRYIHIKLNKILTDLLFPKDDMYILKYTFDEGLRNEPEYYTPIIPLACLENLQQPAHGWQITAWSRDILQVIKNIEKMIRGKISKPKSMNMNLHGWEGTLYEFNDKLFSVGNYTISDDKKRINITELLLQTTIN